MTARPAEFEGGSIEETAAEWLVRRREGLAPELEERYRAWLDADPRHRAALIELEQAWEKVSFPAAVGREREAARMLDRRAKAGRRRPGFLAAAGLAAAVALFFAVSPRATRETEGVPPGLAVRPNIEILSDGSTVELNANAEIAADFTAGRRGVRLLRGEALFSVKQDATRPFVVSAGGVEVKAVGTAFVVRHGLQEVDVLVTEGRVAVARATSGVVQAAIDSRNEPEPLLLDAGRSVSLAADTSQPVDVKPLSPAEISGALAWREKRLEFTRMALAEAVELFNRQNRVQLAVADAAAATIPISGIFWADDPEAFARLLEAGMGVSVEREADTIRLRRR